MNWKRGIVSFFVASCVSFIIFLTLNDFGITWDEPIYYREADQYIAWLKRPSFADKDKSFQVTSDDMHPPLVKVIAGITHDIFTSRFHIIDNTRGYRISSLFFVFPFIFIFSYIAIGYIGYAFGILMPLMFSFLPHVLFLTPLVTMDYAISVLWFIAVITGVKGMKQCGWLIISSACVGFAMLTKLHGYVLFIPLGVVWLATYWKEIVHSKSRKKLFIAPLIYIAAISFTVYIVFWPWLWTAIVPHLKEYFLLQMTHAGVPVMIFGHTYAHAPWWYVPIIFFTTTPIFILLFFIFGSGFVLKRGSFRDRVFLMNALFPMLFFMLPMVNRYDGIRLFLPAFPFVCLIAGKGMQVAVQFLKKKWRIIATGILLGMWVLTVYWSVIRIHPWESSYYNEIVGGIPGAYKIGFETEFWGNAYLGVLPWMNAHKANMMCVTPTTQPFYYYQAMGQIEGGVVFNAGLGACKYAVVLMRQGLFLKDPFIATIVMTRKPIYTVSVQGVTLVGVYDIGDIKK